jgi:pyruvate dehydrogenase complex dehydrogenase (E1) component
MAASSEAKLDSFRREVDGKGLSSYPHPWLQPDFWQFPTVSMGLGPLQAVYQARFMKYLHDRGIADTSGRKVWAFIGDGEVDEPETLAGLGIAARENLDNLIFVVNCNLQRLDGPVRGNGKIIQELEGHFRGAGWNVIKCIWGRRWDSLLANDATGMLVRLMGETVDGDYQTFKSRDGAYVRENFFGKYPGDAKRWSKIGPTTTSGGSIAAATIPTKSTPRTRPPSITPAARPSFSRKPSKATASAAAGEGYERRAQHEEARRRSAAFVPRSLLDSDLR